MDKFFNYELWEIWKGSLFWFLTTLGIIGGLYALNSSNNIKIQNTKAIGFIVCTILIIFLGFFPIEWGTYTDREYYAKEYIDIQTTGIITRNIDYGFSYISVILSHILSVELYFVIISFIYLFNYSYTIAKLVNKQYFWLLLIVVLSLGFTAYNINTMRAGLAISVIVLSVAFYPNKKKMIFCFIIAALIHKSVLIPCFMMVIAYFNDKSKIYFYLWLLSIPLSFATGSLFNTMFTALSDDYRTEYLIKDNSEYNTGFRIDFIIYSLLPIIIGWYYIFKLKYKDKLYHMIYNSYILTNIFWILVIRANYSDRFAYLSWFLIPFILGIPLLKGNLKINSGKWIGLILLGETTFMFLI